MKGAPADAWSKSEPEISRSPLIRWRVDVARSVESFASCFVGLFQSKGGPSAAFQTRSFAIASLCCGQGTLTVTKFGTQDFTCMGGLHRCRSK